MAHVLFTSGFPPTTLRAMRSLCRVTDISNHREALIYLQQATPLPDAVVVGHAVPPEAITDSLSVEPAFRPVELPAHEMLAQVFALDADLPVIVSTAMAESDAIVYLMRRGAFDYVIEPTKPVSATARQRYTQRLSLAVTRALRWREVVLENRQLRHAAKPTKAPAILGQSAAMERVRQLVHKVAPTPATVLLTGASGTGKELLARTIHETSDRKNQPFLALNCGALEDTLLRSELFGHERGAFTGADTRRLGLLREAGRGTLLLDEIATISHAFQVALLRVLEERTARSVGGQQHYPVQCRIIAASNRDLADMVAAGQFRQDLYYRLNVFRITLPPLRDHRVDIPLLAQHFLHQFRDSYGKPNARFTHAAMDAMERHDWPGNVRELRNVIERALILCEEDEIRPADLGLTSSASLGFDMQDTPGLKQAIEQLETRLIRQALAQTNNNLAAAARMLKIKRPTLHYRIRQLGIQGNSYEQQDIP